MISAFERRFGGLLLLLCERGRALWWRLRGAVLGRKSRVARGCRILRPWCLATGKRVQFEHQVYLKATSDQARIILGDEVFVGFGSELDISERVTIGHHVLIAPGCFITDHNHRKGAHALIAAQGCDSSPVVIGDDVWLGANVVILPGVTIGRGAVVGAGSVVTRDVSEMSIVAGVPAKVIGAR